LKPIIHYQEIPMNVIHTLQNFGRNTSIGAALLSLTIIAPTAMATQSGNSSLTRSQTVSLAGLDLSSPAGMAAAQERVHQTARRLCFQLSDATDLSRQPNYVRCVDEAVASAMVQIAGSVPGLVAQSTSRHVQ
jgi:UrcA family protein